MTPRGGFVVAVWCILGLFCGRSESFRCYVCISDPNDEGCGDPFMTGTKEGDCVMCGKIKGKQSGIMVVTRTCLISAKLPANIAAECKSEGKGTPREHICYCNTDLCNASTRASMTTVLLFLLPTLVLSSRNYNCM
ncbi:hypothetical protein MAR_033698 [Mya arenaria]|uniref:Protein quiver n=1 Tax=Mya arenaria TaxID=6604 RepID=A0ABY7GDX3_MYAAR|nr:protein quiver-like [Mya arenaria]WAR31156.1 hypothetical protein MAR_033698 [Mya arenaria]